MAALQYGAMSNVDARWILEETVAKSMAFFGKARHTFHHFFLLIYQYAIKYCHQTHFFGDWGWGSRQRLYV